MKMTAKSYVRRIRNTAKRAYAENYLDFLTGKAPNEPDPSVYPISYMAAQGVRMQLDNLRKLA
jgi:hypothetical protein